MSPRLRHRLLGLCAVLILAGCSAPPPPTGWTLAPDLLRDWPVGAHRLQLSQGERGPQWTLQLAGQRDAVWQTPPGVAPVGAQQVTLQAHEKRGMVRLDETGVQACSSLHLDRAEPQPDGLLLHGQLQCQGQAQALTLRLSAEPAEVGQAVRVRATLGPGPAQRLVLHAVSAPGEALLGGGMQASRLDWQGQELPLIASEQGVGRGEQPLTALANLTNDGAGGTDSSSYAAVPHWITSAGRSLFVDTHALVRADARAPGRWSLAVQAGEADWVWRQADGPLSLIQAHTAQVGRMRALPDWVMDGALIGLQGGSEVVSRRLAQLRAAGVPLAGLWLQDWVGQRQTSFGSQLWWNWQLDAQRYPEWPALLAQSRREGWRLLGYVNPFLVELPAGDARRRLFDEARQHGYLVPDAQGRPLMSVNTSFSAAHLDLENPRAYAWFKQWLVQELGQRGFSGWMADFGEGLPFEGLPVGPAIERHNRWPERWAQLNREVLQELGLGADGVVFHRSAWSRSPAYATLFWLGDQMVDWSPEDGLASAVTGLLGAGLSGFSLNHSDIGGYTTLDKPVVRTRRSPELLMRWAEFAAFTPVMRTHEGNLPAANAQITDSPALLAHFARSVRLHGCWREERRRLVQEAVTRGWPVNRLVALHDPSHPEAWAARARSMLVGADLFVAPVLEPGQREVDLTLPRGHWRFLWDGRLADPTRHRWPAPLGQPAVFVRDGSKAAREMLDCVRALVAAPGGG